MLMTEINNKHIMCGLRILQVITTLNPASGGPVTAAQSLSNGLQKLGQYCEVVTLDSAHDPGVDDFQGIVHPLGPSLGKYHYNRRLVPWLKLNARRFDAVLVHGMWVYPSFATWLASRSVSFPYFVYAHGMLDPWFKYRYPLKHLKKWLYWPWVDYRVLRDAIAVFYTNEEEKRLASKSFWLYKAKEAVVNCLVSSPEGDAEAQRLDFLDAFPSLKGKQVILFMS